MLRLVASVIGCNYDDLKQRHRERKMKRIFTLACGATSVAAVLGVIFAIYNANMAAKIDKNYKLAMENQYRYMADTADRLFEEGYREDAALVALEALNSDNEDLPYVPQAEYALSEALFTYASGNDIEKDGILEHEVLVSDMKFDKDGCHLITVDTNEKVYLWDIQNDNSLVTSFDLVENEWGYRKDISSFEHIDDEIIICTADGVESYSESGKLLWNVEQSLCTGGLIDAEDNIAIVRSSDALSVVDLSKKEITKTFNTPKDEYDFCDALTYDAENDRIFACCECEDEKEKLYIADLKNNKEYLYDIKENYVSVITFSEDGYVFVLSCNDKMLVGDYTAYIEKINIENGKQEWCHEEKVVESGSSASASAIMKYRNYSDETVDNGAMRQEIVFSVNNNLVCLNAKNGEINSVVEMKDKMAIVTSKQILVLETNSYVPVAKINRGCIFTKDGKVITKYMGDLYSFPFQTVESLKEDANEQFNGKRISDDKRAKYHFN